MTPKKQLRLLAVAALLLYYPLAAHSQLTPATAPEPGKLVVAVLPLAGSNYNNFDAQTAVTSSLENAFSSRKRFVTVDRAKIEELYKERNLQKTQDFIDGKIADQGKSLGADIIVTGSINSLNAVAEQFKSTNYSTNQVTYYTKYNGMINLSISLIDVATGSVKASRQFSFQTKETTILGVTDGTVYNTALEAMTAVVNSLRYSFITWINQVFPEEMKIIKIDKLTKKGLPETVLIKGGEEMNLSHNKTFLTNNSTELLVYKNEIITVDGKNYPRPVTVGKIRILEVQGEFSVCEVKSGADVIQKEMNAGNTLFLKINKN